jgi:hypothetical protein
MLRNSYRICTCIGDVAGCWLAYTQASVIYGDGW